MDHLSLPVHRPQIEFSTRFRRLTTNTLRTLAHSGTAKNFMASRRMPFFVRAAEGLMRFFDCVRYSPYPVPCRVRRPIRYGTLDQLARIDLALVRHRRILPTSLQTRDPALRSERYAGDDEPRACSNLVTASSTCWSRPSRTEPTCAVRVRS